MINKLHMVLACTSIAISLLLGPRKGGIVRADEVREINFTIEVLLIPSWEKSSEKAIRELIKAVNQNLLDVKKVATDTLLYADDNLSWRQLSIAIQYNRKYTPDGFRTRPLKIEIREKIHNSIEPLYEILLENAKNKKFFESCFFAFPDNPAQGHFLYDILFRLDLMYYRLIQVNQYISDTPAFLDSVYQALLEKQKNFNFK